MKLIELGSKHITIALTLSLVGAVAACGGDDTNGSSAGTGGGGTGGTGGGTGGSVVRDGSPDGNGGRDASEEPIGTGGTTGSGGTSAEAEAGTGGGTPDATDGATPEAAVDAAAPDADVSVTEPGDAPVIPQDGAADGGIVTDDSPANVDGSPTDDSAMTDAGGPILFSFNAPDPGDHYGWRPDAPEHGTVAVIAEGAPQSPNGSLEFTADFGDAGALSEVSFFYSYSPDDGSPPIGTSDYAAYTTVHVVLRFRTAPPPEVAALKPFLIGGSRADEGPNFTVYLEPLGQPALFAGGTWVDAPILIQNLPDGGIPSIPDIADLWKIGVSVDLNSDAGVPSAPVVIDIDDIYVTR